MTIHMAFVYGIIIACVGTVGYVVVTRAALLHESRQLIAQSAAYQQEPTAPDRHILIVGDSTAVGTGAEPAASVAGLLGRDIPRAVIENRAVNGATASDVRLQLAEAARPRYDLVLVHAGANDILQFRRIAQIEQDIRDLVTEASSRGDRVLFLTAGNIGGAPIFVPPLSTWYTHQTRAVRERVRTMVDAHGVEYVDLFLEPEVDPFLKDPWRYHAADGLHPSERGYRDWYERIRATLGDAWIRSS